MEVALLYFFLPQLGSCRGRGAMRYRRPRFLLIKVYRLIWRRMQSWQWCLVLWSAYSPSILIVGFSGLSRSYWSHYDRSSWSSLLCMKQAAWFWLFTVLVCFRWYDQLASMHRQVYKNILMGTSAVCVLRDNVFCFRCIRTMLHFKPSWIHCHMRSKYLSAPVYPSLKEVWRVKSFLSPT